MSFPVDDILPLIPQKPPFVMVDKLLFTDAAIARSSFIVSKENVFVKGGRFMEGGLLENMAQTAALGAGYLAKAENRPVANGYIAAVKDMEIFSLPGVNDELITEISFENKVLNISVLSGKIWSNGQLIAVCEIRLFSENV